jgi:hypothetical protein
MGMLVLSIIFSYVATGYFTKAFFIGYPTYKKLPNGLTGEKNVFFYYYNDTSLKFFSKKKLKTQVNLSPFLSRDSNLKSIEIL